MLKTLKELYDTLGCRKLSVVKELTKLHENVNRTTIEEAISYYTENEPKGEYVLVIEGKSKEECENEIREKYENLTIEEHVKMYVDTGMDKKEAMKVVAKERGLTKRDVYNALV